MTNLRGVIDPFNGGSTETLNSHVITDEQQRAALAIMRRFAGTGDLWDMLGAFGLDAVAQEMLLSRRVSLGYVPPTPEPLTLVPESPAARTAPETLRYPHLPAHRQGSPRWVHDKRKADAIAKAQRVLVEFHAARELPAHDERGNAILRCARRIHYKIGDNVRVRGNGKLACVACEKIRYAQTVLRQFGEIA
jgi:hypothetical protein